MTNYRLPMDADGVKYHGTVDQNEENPGHFMYGLDENGNKRIIRTDEQGNVLTRVTGSIVEEHILVNQEAITDTDFIQVTIEKETMNRYKRISFFVRNSLGVEVQLRFLPVMQRSLYVYDADEDEFVHNDKIVVPRYDQFYYIKNALGWLDDLFLDSRLIVRYEALETPTQGSLTIYMMGVK